jgi:hypothetical protein
MAGENVWKFFAEEKVSEIPFFPKTPFTFIQLKRILSGKQLEGIKPKSQSAVTGNMPEILTSDSGMIISESFLQGSRVRKIVISPAYNNEWQLTMKSFRKDFAQEIHFISGKTNYFTICLRQYGP